MIVSLHVKNIALINDLKIDLGSGLNILSGETGAGKSIIIDSLNFVLGDRADKSLIRHGESQASVSAVFSSENGSDLNLILSEAGIEIDDYTIVRRTMSENGKNECRINDTIVTLSVLRRVVTALVDIHSQHEHQSLLSESNHIKMLDNYSKNAFLIRDELHQHIMLYKKILTELSSFPPEDERIRRMDLLQFQIDEITKANIKDGEEEQLVQERNRINNMQKILSALNSASNLIGGYDEISAITALHSAIKELNSISKYNESYSELVERLESTKIELKDILETVNSELSNSGDDVNLDRIEKRIDEIRRIKKRFGSSREAIFDFLEKSKSEFDKLNSAEDRIAELAVDIENESSKVIKLSKKLNAERKETAMRFEKGILSNLCDLGMTSTIFKVEIIFPDTDNEILEKATSSGADFVRFLISPNKGEPLKSLTKIASGGELNRFMLAFKNITATSDGIETLVFDEIDSGISGRIAKVVACKLYNIAIERQVIAVTHLPQLASMSDKHYLISKEEKDGKTFTYIEPLELDASLKEIMRLSGSDINSVNGLANAKELKKWADDYKMSKIILK
ncbi:MAG: DNA repair protein RecN [Christensenellaceae bacterium]|jgi:DNA repair protein RecN (Recombination protein N)|nr:DNA repair protein RecN [Christensenellaceae bacterium]